MTRLLWYFMPQKLKRIFFWCGIALIISAVAGLSLFLYISSSLPSVEEINNRQVIESTKIYDRTGATLLYEIHGEEKRTTVSDAEIPQSIKNATISVEDASFYTEPAFDWRGILRAIYVDITRGKALQGGSTITQQLAKKAFLTDDRTIIRKLKELLLAIRLDKIYTKDQILDLYLNQIPYGSNTYGIESAASTFFGIHAKDLDLAQSALLASLPNAPSYYSPYGSHVDELMSRKNFVLKRMNELGYITSAQLKAAQNEKIQFQDRSSGGIKAPHFVTYVQDYLNSKYGEDYVRTAGLRVTTTLDWDLEQIAEKAVKNGVARNTSLYGGTNGALVAIDPKTGQILSMVGSADYFDLANEGNFNVAAQGLRQPGSTFKPFAYLTAFQKGLTPDTIVWDTPTEFDTTHNPDNSYAPNNNDGLFLGPIKLKDALASSRNVPSVKTLYLAGVKNTIDNATKFGISTLTDPNRYGLSLVLGGGEVTLLDMTGAYGVFATEGTKNTPTSILKIEDKDGNTLEEYQDQSEKVVDPQYPRLIDDILSDTNLRSGLFHTNLNLTQVPGYQIALKTGTTNDFVDAWTMGFTPNLVVGVWAGNNHREPLKSKAGSVLAAVPIWHDFISQALATNKFPNETFTPPDPIQVENPTVRGELVTDPNGQYHDLLYYLNRLNDPQYQNWEDGVKLWLTTNSVDPSKFAAAPPPSYDTITPQGNLQITIKSPQNGDTVSGSQISVNADVTGSTPISKIELYFNGALIDTRLGNGSPLYSYSIQFSPASFNPQNLLTIKAADDSSTASKDIILYH